MTDPRESFRSFAPNPVAVNRIVRRAVRTMNHPPRPRRFPFAILLLPAGVVAAAFLWLRAPEPRPLGAERTVALADVVTLDVQGEGTLLGEASQARITWESGELAVEVRPDRGVNLRVETDEGTATVVGTGFVVTRDALGTRVDVRHGTVAVDCVDGHSSRLEAGGSTTCLPVRAAGLLARARALEAGGAPLPDVLAALDAGLRSGARGVAQGELAARRIRVLATLGRVDEAAVAADTFLAGSETYRRAEVLALALDLAVRRGDCARVITLAATADSADTAVRAALSACPQIP